MTYYIGCDVGTGSVRAGLVDRSGKLLARSEKEISIKNYNIDFYEQSSEEIWTACCEVIKDVTSGVARKDEIKGIGFCATCSLVLLDKDAKPCQINKDHSKYDIIMWMDHRADEETKLINQTNDEVLKYVGGKISLEMQMPKIIWMKKHRPEQFAKLGYLFDLPDFLTFKATGSFSRSLCSVSCKWTHTHQRGWSADFLRQIGLDELISNNFEMIGNDIKLPGEKVGKGLNEVSAAEMNLLEHTKVAVSLIDAHCGGIGMIGADCSNFTGDKTISDEMTKRLGIICGTSSCHMSSSKNATFVPGVWGPYYSAMLPGYWLNEGGQSATGKLIDFVVETHPSYKEACKMQQDRSFPHLHQLLNKLLEEKFASDDSVCDFLTRHYHVWPDYHGNRSPVADSSLCGSLCGLKLDSSVDNLLLQYLATLQALALGTRHIVETLAKARGDPIESVFMCGGLSKNELFVQIHADVLGMNVVRCEQDETVLVGASILAALASGDFPSVESAMKAMSHARDVTLPRTETRDFYNKKYEVFKLMLKNQIEYRNIMNGSPPST